MDYKKASENVGNIGNSVSTIGTIIGVVAAILSLIGNKQPKNQSSNDNFPQK